MKRVERWLTGCEHCGKQFPTIRKTQKFCTRGCSDAWKVGRLLPLTQKIHIGDGIRGRHHSIESRLLMSRVRKSKRSGESKRVINKRIRKSVEYVLWREAVFRRDNWTCLDCGIRGSKLNADHVKPFALYPELRFEVPNGRTLCVPCHMKTPTWGKRFDLVEQPEEVAKLIKP